MRQSKKLFLLLALIAMPVFLLPSASLATENEPDVLILDPLQKFKPADPKTVKSEDVIGRIQARFAGLVSIMFGLLAILSLIPIVIGGQALIVSSGNPEMVTKGKNTLFWGVMGLVIGLSGIGIYFFFIELILAPK